MTGQRIFLLLLLFKVWGLTDRWRRETRSTGGAPAQKLQVRLYSGTLAHGWTPGWGELAGQVPLAECCPDSKDFKEGSVEDGDADPTGPPPLRRGFRLRLVKDPKSGYALSM